MRRACLWTGVRSDLALPKVVVKNSETDTQLWVWVGSIAPGVFKKRKVKGVPWRLRGEGSGVVIDVAQVTAVVWVQGLALEFTYINVMGMANKKPKKPRCVEQSLVLG